MLILLGDDGVEYEIDEHCLLGKGGSGKVYKGRRRDTGEVVAIKQFRTKNNQPIQGEFDVIKKLNDNGDNGIVNAITIIKNKKDSTYLHVLEYCSGGNLLSYILQDLQSYSLLSKREEIINSIFKQLLQTITHIHHRGFVHRDLKPENILISSLGYMKICDFGIATMANITDDELVFCKGRCGSEPYMAPEEFGHQYYEGRPVDMWALGIIYYNLIFSKPPWSKANREKCEAFRSYCTKKDTSNIFFKRATHGQQQILSNLLEINPSKRWTTTKICELEYFRDIKIFPIKFDDPTQERKAIFTTLLAHWTTTL